MLRFAHTLDDLAAMTRRWPGPGPGALPNTTWLEYGARLGYRFNDRLVIDAFVIGTAFGEVGSTLHGGIGLTTDLPIEKFWRNQRSFMITEGPIEILKMTLARHVLRSFA